MSIRGDMHIRILAEGRYIVLLSLSGYRRAVASGAIAPEETRWDDWSALRFFRQHFRDATGMGTLRQALAQDMLHLNRLSDDDVRLAAARRLRDGSWQVGSERARSEPGAPARMPARPVQPPEDEAPAPPSRGKQAPAPVPVFEEPEPAPREWLEDTDQAAFAGALEQAARGGKPFCEICTALTRAQAGTPA